MGTTPSARAIPSTAPIRPPVMAGKPITGIEGVVEPASIELETVKSNPVKVKIITTDSFIAISDHPSQRDTEYHAVMARRNHLAKSSETHRVVSVANFEGVNYKLDGHTRSLLWKSGELKKPDTLIAHIYECSSHAEMVDLYNNFDNRAATKNSKDEVSSALRYNGIEVSSNMMKSYKYNNAFRVLHTFVNNTKNAKYYSPINTIGAFKDEIELFDSITPNPNVFRSGAVVGAMILLKRYGEDILPFLAGVSRNEGKKELKTCDAIFAANRVIDFNRQNSAPAVLDLAGKIISCGESYMAKRNYSVLSNGNVFVKANSNIMGYYRNANERYEQRKAKEAAAQTA